MEDPKVRDAQNEVARAQAMVNMLENASAAAARLSREKAQELAAAEVTLQTAKLALARARGERMAS